MIFNPLHYLAVLEHKTNALDQAVRRFKGGSCRKWQLPEESLELRRQMETRLGQHGRREYGQVLRLLETFSLAEVALTRAADYSRRYCFFRFAQGTGHSAGDPSLLAHESKLG